MKIDKKVIDRAMSDHEFRTRMWEMMNTIKVEADYLGQRVVTRNELDWDEELELNKKELRRVYYAAKRIVAMFEEAA